MSGNDPTDPIGGSDPFRGVPFLGDLARMVGGQGPVSWDAARQLAYTIAGDGRPESNVDPIDRLRLDDLARVAELHVANVTGFDPLRVRIEAVTPTTWAHHSLDAYRPLLETLGAALSTPSTSGATDVADVGAEDDAESEMLSGLLRMLSPITLGMSAGSMIGHMARRSFGQYDLPIPRPGDGKVLIIPSAIDRFATDWSLPVDDVRLWVLLHELTNHSILTIPHIHTAMATLIERYVAAFRPNPHALEEHLRSLDTDPTTSMSAVQDMFSRPELLLGVTRTGAQDAVAPLLDALVAVIVGYVDHVLDRVGGGLIGSHRSLSEAIRRQRVESDQADQFVRRLLGVSVTQGQVERGSAFITGVIERAGDAGLSRLWSADELLPTPSEVDAPGLWLARIDL